MIKMKSYLDCVIPIERNSVGKLAAAHARANSEGIERNHAVGNYIKVFYRTSSIATVISNFELVQEMLKLG